MILLLLSLVLTLDRDEVADAVATVVVALVLGVLFAVVVTPFEMVDLAFASDLLSVDFSSAFFCTAATPT